MGTLERAKAVEALEDEMRMLDAKTNELLNNTSHAYKKRRAQTPDSFLLEQHHHNSPSHQAISHLEPKEDGVRIRSKSLEGLLGDGPSTGRDSVQVNLGPPSNHRGRPPPPPPTSSNQQQLIDDVMMTSSPSRPNVEDIQRAMALMQLQQDGHLDPTPTQEPPGRNFQQFDEEDDSHWRESLRRASHRHQRSLLEDNNTSSSNSQPERAHPSHQPFLEQGLLSKTSITTASSKFRISAENAGLLGRRVVQLPPMPISDDFTANSDQRHQEEDQLAKLLIGEQRQESLGQQQECHIVEEDYGIVGEL